MLLVMLSAIMPVSVKSDEYETNNIFLYNLMNTLYALHKNYELF